MSNPKEPDGEFVMGEGVYAIPCTAGASGHGIGEGRELGILWVVQAFPVIVRSSCVNGIKWLMVVLLGVPPCQEFRILLREGAEFRPLTEWAEDDARGLGSPAGWLLPEVAGHEWAYPPNRGVAAMGDRVRSERTVEGRVPLFNEEWMTLLQ